MTTLTGRRLRLDTLQRLATWRELTWGYPDEMDGPVVELELGYRVADLLIGDRAMMGGNRG